MESETVQSLNLFPLELQITVKKVCLFTTFSLIFHTINIDHVIRMDYQIHMPMCFFISHLSFSDVLCSTAVDPKMLVVNLLAMSSNSITFSWLYFGVLHLLPLFRCGVYAAGNDGIWSVQGSQQLLVICSRHLQQGVLPTPTWGLLGKYCDAHLDILYMYLLVQWDQPFLIWFTCTFSPFLFWNTSQWRGLVDCYCFNELSIISWGLVFFCCHLISPEDPLYWWEFQSLDYLYFPFHTSCSFSWNNVTTHVFLA